MTVAEFSESTEPNGQDEPAEPAKHPRWQMCLPFGPFLYVYGTIFTWDDTPSALIPLIPHAFVTGVFLGLVQWDHIGLCGQAGFFDALWSPLPLMLTAFLSALFFQLSFVVIIQAAILTVARTNQKPPTRKWRLPVNWTVLAAFVAMLFAPAFAMSAYLWTNPAAYDFTAWSDGTHKVAVTWKANSFVERRHEGDTRVIDGKRYLVLPSGDLRELKVVGKETVSVADPAYLSDVAQDFGNETDKKLALEKEKPAPVRASVTPAERK